MCPLAPETAFVPYRRAQRGGNPTPIISAVKPHKRASIDTVS